MIQHLEPDNCGNYVVMDTKEYAVKILKLEKYLREVIKNDEKCKNCIFKYENNVCFFAYECIKNNHNHLIKLELEGGSNERHI